ncbi:MAG: glycosyltransferase, partial [Proteobacteria bacterium]|nr:glycosyltransferase [Pseudomonadota bacterium]
MRQSAPLDEAAPPEMPMEALREALSVLFDPAWYLERYPDVARARIDPLDHFIRNGVGGARDPNPFFDSAWYRAQYADVGGTGIPPLLHYVRTGAALLRNPHPRFDAAWYARQHPEAAANPLLFHLRVGAARGYPTEKPVDPRDFLPARASPLPVPRGVSASVVIPVYRGLDETRRCLFSVLADDARLAGEVIVIDDASPEPALSAWLDTLAQAGRIRLIRHARNLGFVAAANRGMREAGRADAILLNSDTEVPRGWTRRL